MGTPLDKKDIINKLKRSSTSNYIAEIFFEELQFVLNEDLSDSIMVICHGMNPRIQSKDILSTSVRYVSTPTAYKEIVTLHLARNSIYHQLPELLFHPLVISTPGMSNKEIVDAIRANKKKEKELISFFSPFDTAFFQEHVSIIDRCLNYFTNPASKESLKYIIETLLGTQLAIPASQKYKLFLFLCNAEKYKENLPAIEQIFSTVLGLEVNLKYVPHIITDSLYKPLNEGKLGEDIGLNGIVECEGDDLEATVTLSNPKFLDDYNFLTNIKDTVSTILNFFILSFRKIRVEYKVQDTVECMLGNCRLGYDMIL